MTINMLSIYPTVTNRCEKHKYVIAFLCYTCVNGDKIMYLLLCEYAEKLQHLNLSVVSL